MQGKVGPVASMVGAVAALEFFGGLFLILGLIVPVVSAFYVIFFASNYIDPSNVCYEGDALYLLLSLIIAIFGAGPYSSDALIGFKFGYLFDLATFCLI